MRYRDTGRATSIAILPTLVRRWIAIAALLMIVGCLVIPTQVLAYRENMMELVVASNPPIIVQNQSYTTTTRQDLFHTATKAAADTEAFAFSGQSPTGIDLAQTSSFIGAGTETGYFLSTAASDMVAPIHIGNGYLGTWIADPIRTNAPVFSGLMFPQMTRVDPGLVTPQRSVLSTAGSPMISTSDAGSNKTKKDVAVFKPVINNDLSDTPASQDVRNATAAIGSSTNAANATKQNATAQNATSKPTVTPSPVIKPGQVFYHQQNKPFSEQITSPSGPFKATPEKIQNTSGFDRFLMNTVARSTTDKAFNGTTSSPTYIKPAEALAVQIPYDFIQGARGMTMPGTRLNYRAWPL